MQTIIKNMYKMPGVFICRHPRHRRFDYQVSPYHVIQEKRCLEEGCLQFLWKCRIHAKDFRCPRGYRHVGKDCFTCRHYDEDKIWRKPEAIIGESELMGFWRKLDEYRLWLSLNLDKKISFSGKISSVFPLLYMKKRGGAFGVRASGYLIGFDRGYIGYDLYDDKIYLRTGGEFIKRWNPTVGDSLEFRATLKADRGRLILIRPGEIEIESADPIGSGNGYRENKIITLSQAVVGASTGAIVEDSCAPCRGCNYGAFVEFDTDQPQPAARRRFFCLRGVKNAATCPIRLARILADRNLQVPDEK